MIGGATKRRYRLTLDDLGKRIAVRVTATDEAAAERDGDLRGDRPRRPRHPAQQEGRPRSLGTARFTHGVRATTGRWSTEPTRVRYQWLRSGRPIAGATGPRYRFVPDDVERRLRVQVAVKAPGYSEALRMSPRAAPVGHRVDVRRMVALPRRDARKDHDQPEGLSAAGTGDVRPTRAAGAAPGSGSVRWPGAAASRWSWRRRTACPASRPAAAACGAAGSAGTSSSTRSDGSTPRRRGTPPTARCAATGTWSSTTRPDTGSASGTPAARGRAAGPVMMQQSKGLGGCRFNPWPTAGELASRTRAV